MGNGVECMRVNSQWAANSAETPSTGMMIPVIDVSDSMGICDDSRPLYSAIGTGLRISENAHPALRNRALTFAGSPSWFAFDSCKDFVSRVNTIRNNRNWDGSTDLVRATEMVVSALQSANVPAAEAAELVIVVLSDMQIDCGSGANWDDTAFERVAAVCKAGGYEPFHFVWWNLRTTSGLPVPTNARNTTMVSGYNAALLKSFEGKGMEAPRDYTPERMIQDIVTSDRLKPLGALFDATYPEM